MSNTYTPTIGLEIHAELKTRTKMFCNSANDPNETNPNVNICPVCVGFPGTLPVANHEAVRHVLRVGVALGGNLADYTEFDRKNYFYPDLPKGYQISQYEFPLVSGGSLAGVSITRVHLEEDTARSQHLPARPKSDAGGPAQTGEGDEWSLVDFNRSGVPLMELVTEPVIHDAKTASTFAQELQLLLRYLGAGDANMEKGEMRVEANISLSKNDSLGTKVEVKNLNSFKSVEKAILHEIDRQSELLGRGEEVIQETRGWDEVKESTFSQRLKESSHDYRYFPDPDIPKFRLSRIDEFSEESLSKSLPELPWLRRKRYVDVGLKSDDAEILVRDPLYGEFFDEEVLKHTDDEAEITLGANYLLSDLRAVERSSLEKLKEGRFMGVIGLIRNNEISSRGAKDLLAILIKEPGNPRDVAQTSNLLQVNDPEIVIRIAEEILLENKKVVSDIESGKEEAMKYLLGQGMKKSRGSVNPSELEKVLREKIASQDTHTA